jgi:hypothetical protein
VGGHLPLHVGSCGAQGPESFRQFTGKQVQDFKLELLIPHSVTAQMVMVDRMGRHAVDGPARRPVTASYFAVFEHDALLRHLRLEVNAIKMTLGL